MILSFLYLFSPSASPIQKPNGKRVKESRRWDNTATGEEAAALDFSSGNMNGKEKAEYDFSTTEIETLSRLRGTMKDDLDEVHVSSDEDEDLEVLEIEENDTSTTTTAQNGTTLTGNESQKDTPTQNGQAKVC
ncbi:unnamed protein product [Trichobilharzia regenti]|nr:unnamed protein product [Trichobilharzia regenti]